MTEVQKAFARAYGDIQSPTCGNRVQSVIEAQPFYTYKSASVMADRWTRDPEVLAEVERIKVLSLERQSHHMAGQLQ
jgi:phage terminase small subunit